MCVLFSSALFVIFKLFSRYKIQTLYAIITNYFTASFLATFFYDGPINYSELPAKPWFLGTVLLGVLFIVVFNITAKTSQNLGVSVASVAAKMSLVIPVMMGVLLYGETLGTLKITGIVLALAAVYFASIKNRTITVKVETLILPLLLFMGSGMVDAGIKFLQTTDMATADFPLFSSSVFGAAGTTGIVFILIRSARHPLKLNLKNLIAGIVLGSFNYFTIHFLLMALENKALNSASIFTIINVGTVLFSTLMGILLFREHLSMKNWAGLGLAVISIVLVALF
jgi:multidrug transporter EmrE-like cation transporter